MYRIGHGGGSIPTFLSRFPPAVLATWGEVAALRFAQHLLTTTATCGPPPRRGPYLRLTRELIKAQVQVLRVASKINHMLRRVRAPINSLGLTRITPQAGCLTRSTGDRGMVPSTVYGVDWGI